MESTAHLMEKLKYYGLVCLTVLALLIIRSILISVVYFHLVPQTPNSFSQQWWYTAFINEGLFDVTPRKEIYLRN